MTPTAWQDEATQAAVARAVGRAEAAFDSVARDPAVSVETGRQTILAATAAGSPAQRELIARFDDLRAADRLMVENPSVPQSAVAVRSPIVAGTEAHVMVCVVRADSVVEQVENGTEAIAPAEVSARLELQTFAHSGTEWLLWERVVESEIVGGTTCAAPG